MGRSWTTSWKNPVHICIQIRQTWWEDLPNPYQGEFYIGGKRESRLTIFVKIYSLSRSSHGKRRKRRDSRRPRGKEKDRRSVSLGKRERIATRPKVWGRNLPVKWVGGRDFCSSCLVEKRGALHQEKNAEKRLKERGYRDALAQTCFDEFSARFRKGRDAPWRRGGGERQARSQKREAPRRTRYPYRAEKHRIQRKNLQARCPTRRKSSRFLRQQTLRRLDSVNLPPKRNRRNIISWERKNP